MTRPVAIQDEAILEAARDVFLRHGYRACTAQVARKAGVSEGSIFNRFKNKQALFIAAMEAEPGGQAWQDKLMQSAGTADLRRTLEWAGMQMLERLTIILPRVMMIRTSGILFKSRACGAKGGPPGPVQKIQVLADYLRAECRCGRLCSRTPEVHAQVFVGALTQYVVQQILYNYRIAPPEVYVRTVVEMLLKAVGSAPAAARPARGRLRPRRGKAAR